MVHWTYSFQGVRFRGDCEPLKLGCKLFLQSVALQKKGLSILRKPNQTINHEKRIIAVPSDSAAPIIDECSRNE